EAHPLHRLGRADALRLSEPRRHARRTGRRPVRREPDAHRAAGGRAQAALPGRPGEHPLRRPQLPPARRGVPHRGAGVPGAVHERRQRGQPPGRPDRVAAGAAERRGRLRVRAGRRDRHGVQERDAQAGAQARAGLHLRQRRLGPRLADPPRRVAVVPRQDVRHLLPDGPLPRDRRRAEQPQLAVDQDGPERPGRAGLGHGRHDLRRAGADRIFERQHDTAARHRDPHRHAARRRHGPQAAAVAETGRHGHDRHRAHRRVDQPRRRGACEPV
ncbi:MAG: Fumarylacetoacetate hydrolase family protein, partial [uncultured Phycisphaerae bacterium]